MSRTSRGFQKISGGYKWTRSGFMKLPDRFRSISIKNLPLAQQAAGEITPKPKKPRRQAKSRLGVKAVSKPKEQGAENSAPTPAAPFEKRTIAQPRPAWAGKYADLGRLSERQADGE